MLYLKKSSNKRMLWLIKLKRDQNSIDLLKIEFI